MTISIYIINECYSDNARINCIIISEFKEIYNLLLFLHKFHLQNKGTSELHLDC
jgi:hypothetical protein